MQGSLGWRMWGLGIVALGLVSLVLGAFDPGQPVPADLPGRTGLAYAVDGFLVLAGLAVQRRRTALPATAALAAYYLFVVVLLMYGRMVVHHPAEYSTYEAVAEQLAIAAAGVVAYAATAAIDPPRAATLIRIGQVAFGVCAVVFGGAHFVYVNLTAPLVPTWLPPSPLFWAYLTGVAHITAGAAIIIGVAAHLAAVLLTVMFAAFTLLVHLQLLGGTPDKAFFWTENALNLALIGAAWIIADSLAGRARIRSKTMR